jgi:transcriptional regulator with XRE-family HTH domain
VDAYRQERAARLRRFGATLRALRIEKFGSQEAFALEANMNRVHIQYLESGKREPELATLLVLANALEVSLDQLAEGLAVPKERRKQVRGSTK